MSRPSRLRAFITALATALAAVVATLGLSTVSAPTADAATCFNTTLRYGSRGSCVKALQDRLGALSVDGSYGSATRSRVKAFQADTGLTVDGITGPKTWKKLRAYGKALGWKSGATFYLCKVNGSYLRYSVWNNTGKTIAWKFKTSSTLYHNGMDGIRTNKVTRYQSFYNTATSTQYGKYFGVWLGKTDHYTLNYNVRDYKRSSLPTCV
ncbi:MAG TPA: peptidoglycan-binding domain-containing protein [Microlunatus sp.]